MRLIHVVVGLDCWFLTKTLTTFVQSCKQHASARQALAHVWNPLVQAISGRF